MDHIHTRIDEPLDLRKKILESALYATEVLKSSNDFIKFNNDGNLSMNQLKDSLKQLHGELDRLQNILPPLPDEFRRIQSKQRRIENRPAPLRKEISANDRNNFDSELREIRAKMAKLMIGK